MSPAIKLGSFDRIKSSFHLNGMLICYKAIDSKGEDGLSETAKTVMIKSIHYVTLVGLFILIIPAGLNPVFLCGNDFVWHQYWSEHHR